MPKKRDRKRGFRVSRTLSKPGQGLRNPDFLPWLAGATALLLYAVTLCPTLWWISSGEFIASAQFLGIPHAPGASAYVLTARLFSLLFPGSAAWGVNLLSAVSAAFCAGAVVKLSMGEPGRRTFFSNLSAFLAGAFFIGSLSLWTQATVGERRTFLLALFAAALLCFQVYLRAFKFPKLLAGFFILGIAATIRPNSVIFAAAVFLFLVFGVKDKKERQGLTDIPSIILVLTAFLIGFSSSLYLALRFPWAPFSFLDFGPVSFTAWAKDISGVSFLSHTRPSVAVSLIGQLPRFVAAVESEFGLLAFLAAVMGFFLFFKRGEFILRLYFILLLADIATWLPFRPFGQGIQHYALFSFFLAVPFIALGIRELDGFLTTPAVKKILTAALAAGILLNAWNHFQAADRSDDFSAQDYANAALSIAGGGSTLFLNSDDEYFSLLPGQLGSGLSSRHLIYVQEYERKEGASWGAGLLDALRIGAVYTAFHDEELAKRFDLTPEGPLYRVLPKSPLKVEIAGNPKRPLAEFENGAQLLEAKVEPAGPPDARLFDLELAWSTGREKISDFWVGIYLSDEKGGYRFLDAFPPIQGALSPSLWKRDEVFREQKVLLLPTDLPSGSYRVQVALYPASKLNLNRFGVLPVNDTLYSEANPFYRNYQGAAGDFGRFQTVMLAGDEHPQGFIRPLALGNRLTLGLASAELLVAPDKAAGWGGPRRRGELRVLADPVQGKK
jgi:hypothetical protein